MPKRRSRPTVAAMASYEIREEASAVSIEVTGVGAQKDQLLEAFDDCRTGHCSCPTDQYDKLAAMQVEQDEDVLKLRLEPKPGTHFDTAEIEHCLDHNLANAKDSP